MKERFLIILEMVKENYISQMGESMMDIGDLTKCTAKALYSSVMVLKHTKVNFNIFLFFLFNFNIYIYRKLDERLVSWVWKAL